LVSAARPEKGHQSFLVPVLELVAISDTTAEEPYEHWTNIVEQSPARVTVAVLHPRHQLGTHPTSLFGAAVDLLRHKAEC
jgi:hypothetical protein